MTNKGIMVDKMLFIFDVMPQKANITIFNVTLWHGRRISRCFVFLKAKDTTRHLDAIAAFMVSVCRNW